MLRSARPRRATCCRPCTSRPRSARACAPTSRPSSGLPAGTPVVGGGGDQAAGAVGQRHRAARAGVVHDRQQRRRVRPLGRARARPGRPRAHLLPRGARRLARDGRDAGRRASRCAGSATRSRGRWSARRPPARDATSTTCWRSRPRRRPPGCDGLFFLPYLMGERTPHLDPQARGVWFGLTAAHRRAHLVAVGAGGRRLQPARLPRPAGRDGRAGRGDPRVGRRREEPALAADPGGRLRPRGRDGQRRRGARPTARRCWRASAPGTGRRCRRRARRRIAVTSRVAPDAARQAVYARGHGVYREVYSRLRTLYPTL